MTGPTSPARPRVEATPGRRSRLGIPDLFAYTRATPHERSLPSHADHLVDPDHLRWVRCITVHAPVDVVYRWICQLTVAPYSYDAIDFPGRRSPRELTPGADRLELGQDFLIFTLASFDRDAHFTGLVRPEYERMFGRFAVDYSVEAFDATTTRLRAVFCIERESGLGAVRQVLLAGGDKIMAGRQLRVLKACAERTFARRHAVM